MDEGHEDDERRKELVHHCLIDRISIYRVESREGKTFCTVEHGTRFMKMSHTALHLESLVCDAHANVDAGTMQVFVAAQFA